MCKLFCLTCLKSFSFRNLATDHNDDYLQECPICGRISIPVFQLTLVVKDAYAAFMDDCDTFYKLNYFTHFHFLDQGKPVSPS